MQPGSLGFRLLPSPCVSMPVHPHFADLAVFRLTEDRSAGVDPFSAAAPPEGAAKLGGEPWSHLEDFTGAKGHLGLRRGDVLPGGADSADADVLTTERGLDEDGIGSEDRNQTIDIGGLPGVAEGVDEL